MPSLSFIIYKRKVKILFQVVVIRIHENKWQLLLFILYCCYLIFTSSELFELKRKVSFGMEIWRETYREQYLWGREGRNSEGLKQNKTKTEECAQ